MTTRPDFTRAELAAAAAVAVERGVRTGGGWVRREAAPRLQDRINKAVADAAEQVAAVKAGRVE